MLHGPVGRATAAACLLALVLGPSHGCEAAGGSVSKLPIPGAQHVASATRVRGLRLTAGPGDDPSGQYIEGFPVFGEPVDVPDDVASALKHLLLSPDTYKRCEGGVPNSRCAIISKCLFQPAMALLFDGPRRVRPFVVFADAACGELGFAWEGQIRRTPPGEDADRPIRTRTGDRKVLATPGADAFRKEVRRLFPDFPGRP